MSAALGWLGLGSSADAAAELAHLPARLQGHPDVLEVKWQINAQQNQWEIALEIARRLLEVEPSRPSGWLHQSYSLRRVPQGTLNQAMQALLPAAEKFPGEPTIPYNLSCYACQLHDLKAARRWLKRAERVAGKGPVKQLALADPDLEPLWEELRGGSLDPMALE